MKKRIATVLAAAVLPLAVFACAGTPSAAGDGPKPEAKPDPKPEPAMERGTVRAIKLQEPQIELPPGPGRESIEAYCKVCHSADYILIQPNFSKETWTAEVTKMQKTYSAPIPDEKIPELVGYLMSVRGAQPAAAK
jgi:hypothetical protein